MKSFIPFLASALILSSCSTAFKTGQTPDDVYFSPGRPQDEYVQVDNNEDRYRYNEDEMNDDRYLRMKVRNRRMWSDLDYYYNDPYQYRYYNNYYSYNRYYNTPWNYYSTWNYFHNPYAPRVVFGNPRTTTYNRPRTFNRNTFNAPLPNNNNPKVSNNPPRVRVFSNSGNSGNYNNNTRRSSDAGSSLRDMFSNSNSSSSNNSSIRTQSNSSSSSSGSSSSSSSSRPASSGGSAPVRKF